MFGINMWVCQTAFIDNAAQHIQLNHFTYIDWVIPGIKDRHVSLKGAGLQSMGHSLKR